MKSKLLELLVATLLGLFVTMAASAADVFAIAADGNHMSANIAELAGIAPYFHIYDENGNLIKILPNPHLNLEYGVGPAAAATLADMGVTVLVAQKKPGPKMETVLNERKVRIVRRLGLVHEVVSELKGE